MSDNDLIRAEDFRSIDLLVSLRNLSTKRELRASEKPGAIVLQEVLDRGVVIETPPNLCQKNHEVEITVEATGPGVEGVLKFSAKCEIRKQETFESLSYDGDEVERFEGARETLTLVFLEFDESDWKSFLSVYENRQNEIESFFHAVKGR